MQWRRHIAGFAFSFVFVVSYFTNKFVLSVLKFTYPTLFQGWQTFIGAILLLLSGKLGWVEMSRITRSAALSWLPGSLLFVGNIYAGSRSLSRIEIPFYFTLQNSSHVVSYIILKVIHREKAQWLKFISLCLMLLSAINLPLFDPQVIIHHHHTVAFIFQCYHFLTSYQLLFLGGRIQVFCGHLSQQIYSVYMLCLFCSLTTVVTFGLSVICSVLVCLRIQMRNATMTTVKAQELHEERNSGPRFEP